MPQRKLVRRSGTSTGNPISAQERAEVRGVIRARVKALKMGIEERRADQMAEVERQINARYAEQKAAFKTVNEKAGGLVVEFNKMIQEVYAPLVGDYPERGGFAALVPALPPDLERQLMRRRANLEIEAAAKTAYSRLVRWEADALEAVARTGIVSSEAQALLDQVATIDMLMPTVELPPTAQTVVTQMVTAEGKMPWVSYKDPNYELYSAGRDLNRHASEWRNSNALPAPSDEQEEDDADDAMVVGLEACTEKVRHLIDDINKTRGGEP